MSFGTRHRRLWSPIVVLLWAMVTVVFAGTAQAVDGTDNQSSVATTAGSDAGSTQAAPAPTPPPPPDHPTAPPATGGTTDHPVSQPVSQPVAEPTSPQPISTADANSGGANGQCPGGPYCSTTDGTASGNGSGGGQATGEPCAGCVGKADNKNPHGQMPNASDANAGYECDTNHGIAQGNPAHSGCLQAPPEVCPTDPCNPPPVCTTEPCNPLPPPPPLCPTGSCVSPPLVSSAAPAAVVSPPQAVAPATLPNTGAPAGLVWLGLGAAGSIIAGTTLLLRSGSRPLART